MATTKEVNSARRSAGPPIADTTIAYPVVLKEALVFHAVLAANKFS
jgi:hypothetical protein